MRFSIGQKVVCVRPTGPFVCKQTGLTDDGPEFNEIVTIHSYCDQWPGNVRISEYLWSKKHGRSRSFKGYYFEPLVSDAVLAEELSQIAETVEA